VVEAFCGLTSVHQSREEERQHAAALQAAPLPSF